MHLRAGIWFKAQVLELKSHISHPQEPHRQQEADMMAQWAILHRTNKHICIYIAAKNS